MEHFLQNENPVWYVMKCRKSAGIADHITRYYDNMAVPERDRIENYFIPSSEYGRSLTREAAARDGDGHLRAQRAISSTLRHFVFLFMRPSGLASLMCQDWNLGDTRIYHYRDASGRRAIVPPEMMTRFMDACLQYGSKMEICTLRRDLEEGITVTVRDGAFAGLEAEVVNLQYRQDGMRFTMAVKLFGRGNYAYVHNRTPEDVIITERRAHVFSPDFVSRIEDSLLTILKRRVKGREADDERESNDELLRDYFRLHRTRIADTALSLRFEALMGICAAMLKNQLSSTRYRSLLKRRLKELPAQNLPADEALRAQAYLVAALFLSTKDPVYRTALKDIVQHHLPTDDPLRRHLAILRLL